jgi:hypothetical protein
MAAYADAVAQALAEPDPWTGFCGYVERVCAMLAEDRGFGNVLTMTFPTARQFEAERDRAYRGFLDLVSPRPCRGQAPRRLRRGGPPDAADGQRRRARRHSGRRPRHLAAPRCLHDQAFSARNAEPLPPPPVPTAMYRALLHLSQAGTRDYLGLTVRPGVP